MSETTDWIKDPGILMICPECKKVSIGPDEARIHYAIHHALIEPNDVDE